MPLPLYCVPKEEASFPTMYDPAGHHADRDRLDPFQRNELSISPDEVFCHSGYVCLRDARPHPNGVGGPNHFGIFRTSQQSYCHH